ncbi:nitrate/nitrite transporter NrtS [Chloroflexales bacterium ZM16-3]|nr:nitrate/nitrite transporter NrtS [Chloroflexales bacterium ZM16-3]
MQEWVTIAREPTVVRRAIRIALIVGTLLIAINHGDALIHGAVGPLRLAQMALTVSFQMAFGIAQCSSLRITNNRHPAVCQHSCRASVGSLTEAPPSPEPHDLILREDRPDLEIEARADVELRCDDRRPQRVSAAACGRHIATEWDVGG